MISVGTLIVFLAVGGVAILIRHKGNDKARRLIAEWSAQNNFQLLSCSWSYFGGKFWFSRSNSQRVYRVSVRDQAGTSREADIRCGSFVSGMLSDNIDVRWRD